MMRENFTHCHRRSPWSGRVAEFHRWLKTMNRLAILCVGILWIGYLAGCTADPTVVRLSDQTLTIRERPTVIDLVRPLARVNRSLSLRLQLSVPWTAEPPWESIRLDDGTTAKINVILVSEKGVEYTPKEIGSGGGVDIRFYDAIPKSERIVRISIASSRPITPHEIAWVDWNPK
jgi:hypothetical protein